MAGLLDFFSPEAGQRRTAALGGLVDRAEYYVPPELRSILGFTGEMSPVAGLQRAGQASERMLDPSRTGGQRFGDLGEMLSETAGVAAPMAVAGRAGMPVAKAVQEGLLGFSAGADDVGRRVLDRLNQPGPVPTMYSNPLGGAKPSMQDALKAKYPDVNISISEGSRGVTLNKIDVPKDKRKTGLGTKVMEDFVRMADESGAVAKLDPSGDFGSSPSRLRKFYKRFGFVENKGSAKDYEISEDMYRQPQRAVGNKPPKDQFKPVLPPKATQPGLLSIPEQTAKPKTSAAELRRQANIQRFGYDPSAVPEAPAPQDISEGFQAYLNQVNPDARRIPPENRPNLMMGDMYGMLPKGAKLVKSSDDVSYYRGPDGDYFATAYNPDVGEMDVVGYSMGGGRETDLQVVDQMQGKGIGGELQYLFRKENPNAPTGGLTEAGEKSLQKTYKRLSDEGVLSMIPAPTPSRTLNPAEQMAKDILDMRAAGRAGEVTDEMMSQADPQYMFANTPLPMDYESRMGRAGEMGFGGDMYHGTTADFQSMKKGIEFYTTPDADYANIYAGSPYDEGGRVLPLMQEKNGVLDTRTPSGQAVFDDNFFMKYGNGSPLTEKGVPDWTDGPDFGEMFSDNSLPYNGVFLDEGKVPLFDGSLLDRGVSTLSFDPTSIRSRFARFDPEFKHLRNLSAGVGGMGLLGMSYPQEGQY